MSLTERLAQAQRDRVPAPERGGGLARVAPHPARSRRSAPVDPFQDLKREVHQALINNLGPKLYDSRLTQPELEQKVRQTLTEVLSAGEMPLTTADRVRIAQEIADDILGYGPIEPYLRDSDVSEVMVNGPDSIYVEREGKIHPVDGRFADEAHLRRTIDKIVGRIGRRVDEASPMCDARLPDGSRVNAIIPPLAVDGSLLTIRKFSVDPFESDDLVSLGTLTRSVADLLAGCVKGRLNILVSGGTGAGKTTTLNVLSGFVPGDERMVTIEDAAELQLHQEHVLRLESRPPNIEGRGEVKIRDLVRNALRMRPDRIVVGEIRDAAALDMLQAMNTGHDGSICTVHANSPRDVLSRVETMVLMAGVDLPMRAIREQIASAIDLIVHQTRFRDGSRRVTQLTEVVGMEGDIITTQDLFMFDHSHGMDDYGRILGTLEIHRHPTQIPRQAPRPRHPRRHHHFRLRTAAAVTAMSSTLVLVAGLVAIFCSLCVIVAAAVGAVTKRPSEETRVLRRLSIYTVSGGQQPVHVSTEASAARLGESVLARSAVDLVGRVVRRGSFDAAIDRRLDAAGLPLRTAEWTLLHIGVGVGVSLIFLLASGGRLLATTLGLVFGLAGPWLFLSLRQGRRERAFLAQLPDTLQLIAGSLQAGYSLPQAMDSVVREGRPPISDEFNRALIEARLGMPAEDAMDAIAARMDSQDFSWIVMAIRIQREVGGNLAELLGTVASTLRDRESQRRQVAALSAEGRLSGWILGMLPVVFTSYLALAKPAYLAQLFNPRGYLMLAAAAILLAVGAFWMSRVVKVEV